MKAKSTINGVLNKITLTVLNVQEPFFFFWFQISNTAYVEEEGEYEEFLLKKGSKINAWETQGNTHVRPIEEGNVEITRWEYRLTINVRRLKSRGTNKLTRQKRLSIFLFSSK